MNFQRVNPNGQYRTLRLVSGQGKWELGMSRYSHGMRLRMGLASRPPGLMDFCMGTNGAIFPEILIAVLEILETLEENVTPDEVDAVFPWAGTRPDLNVHLVDLLGRQVRS